MDIVDKIEQAESKEDVPSFRIGDTVDVHYRIREGEKERVQVFTGTVIGQKGRGYKGTFTVRRIVQGEGVERVFPLHSPHIMKLEVKRTGKARRGKLYYLRDRVGKATRLKERRRDIRPAPAPKPAKKAPEEEEAPPES
jgi:large subunit ribosomal protein L19